MILLAAPIPHGLHLLCQTVLLFVSKISRDNGGYRQQYGYDNVKLW